MKSMKEFLYEKLHEQSASNDMNFIIIDKFSDRKKALKLFDDFHFNYKMNGKMIQFKNINEYEDAKNILNDEKIKYKD